MEANPVTRVVIVEDEALFRNMLRNQLSVYSGIEILGEASTGEQAIELAQSLKPEVMLMDIELGSGMTGIQAGHLIKSRQPSTGIVLLSNHKARQFVVTRGGWSYLLKRNVRDINTVVRAINGASWGMIFIDPQVTESFRPRDNTPLSRLEPDEMKTLELLAHGYNDHAIAQEMRLTPDGLVKRLNAIFAKLGVSANGEVDPRVAAIRTYFDQTRSL